MNETAFTPIGSELQEVNGVSQYVQVEHPVKSDVTAFNTACGTISGMNPNDYDTPIGGFVNDGTVTNGKANFARIVLRANVPDDAPAGSMDFLTRVRYSYI